MLNDSKFALKKSPKRSLSTKQINL